MKNENSSKTTRDDIKLFHLPRNQFLFHLGYRDIGRKHRFFDTVIGKVLLCIFTCVILALLLLMEYFFGSYPWNFQVSHVYGVAALCVFFFAFVWFRDFRVSILSWLGIDGSSSDWKWLFPDIALALVLAVYVLFEYTIRGGNSNEPTPTILAFSIPVVSATLTGVAVSSSNNTRLSSNNSVEFLRVAHKLAIATIMFVFFVVAFSFLLVFEKVNGNVDPNKLAWGQKAITGGVLFWGSGISLVLGSSLFTNGIRELLLSWIKMRSRDDNTKNNH
jgi:hypothetical protein